MTSRHLFFKAMREDLRHKIWMIALSALGNFLMLPVPWLMYISDRSSTSYEYLLDMSEAGEVVFQQRVYLEPITFIFRDLLTVGGGFIAIVGAIIVGLFGFRYVFHKNMVDTYHSIPVKRRTLYGVCWLNGFLIWLVPFLACLLVTMGLALAYLAGTPGAQYIPQMLAEIGINLLLLTIVFLLVYHLVITAVMISGNVLNTLVSMLILGFGAISVFGLGIAFFTIYLGTFYSAAVNPYPAVYASPLLSPGYLLYQMKEQTDFGQIGPVSPILINVCVMAFLGGLAWLLYKRRASELAEQGIRNKVFNTAMKFLVGLAAGMSGWLVFYLMVASPGWGVFGALLAEILAFGIMDIIFSMEFKAFFAHKLQMGVTAVISLAVCFCFYGDWMGYDTYLPDKEDIAEIAIYSNRFTNRSWFSYSDSQQYMLDHIHLQDADAVYAYLERMTDKEKGPVSTATYPDANYDNVRTMSLTTRVTLKNGRTYYRAYSVAGMDLDVIWPLLSDRDFLEKNYMVDRQMVSTLDRMELLRAGSRQMMGPDTGLTEEDIWTIAEAYNKDILEDPAPILLDRGTLLVSLELDRVSSFSYRDLDTPQIYYMWMEVYDSMEHTMAALEELGYGEWIQPQDPDEISEIRLTSDIWYDSIMEWDSVQSMTDCVRAYYGVTTEDTSEAGESSVSDVMYGNTSNAYVVQTESFEEGRLYLSITDKEEIRELMQYMNYATPYRMNNVFRSGFVDIEVIIDDEDTGDRYYQYYLREGELPEKYIQRFEQLFLSLRQN